jgi:hypothetical protein
MVPRSHPSTFVTANGQTRMVVDIITDTTGLVRWVDYIPVQQTTASPHIPNSYDNDGAIELDVLADTTGLMSWKDYIVVYEDVAATKPWLVSSDGFIPVFIPEAEEEPPEEEEEE